MGIAMIRPVLLYGSALAACALVLQWLDYRYAMRLYSTEFYTGAIAVMFTLLGLWVGNRLTPRIRPSAFERNDRAIATLGISTRECEVLELLAQGCSTKLIARRLTISPNTVKTHLARLFEKLGTESRTQAIHKARSLGILP
jgi:DNA-binding CsgD family transcriptional regulator